MTKFNGKNSLKTSRLAFERAKYKTEAFEETDVHVKDFNFAERTFYGRVNRFLEPVIVSEEFLKPISSASPDPSSFRAINFVADQYLDMELHFSKACRMGAIPIDDPVLSSLKVKRAYESPLQVFKQTSRKQMYSILDNFISLNKKRVNSLSDFLTLFVNFYTSNDVSNTLILSDFMKSQNSSPYVSGLCIDIAGLSYSDDRQKETQMLNSPAFKYYMNIAKQYGFSVHQNNPGVLISDLASPVTKEYRSRYDLTTVQSIFDIQYEKTVFYDLKYLEELLIDTYNTYVSNNPYNTYYKSCNNNTVSSITIINNSYSIDYNYIINIYINMKNFFEGSPLSPAVRNQVIQTAQSIGKYDKEKTLLYIEDQFKSHYNQKDGSLTYFRKRTKNT